MEYNIRKCQSSDVNEVYRLVNQLKERQLDKNVFYKKFNQNILDKNIEYWCLTVNEKTMGFVSVHKNLFLHHNAPIYEIQEFIIDKDYRVSGYGSKLMQFIIGRFNNKELELASNKQRVKSKQFFEKWGFMATHNKFVLKK